MNKGDEFIDVDGLTLSSVYDPAVVRQAMKYKPEKDEVIVASYPKCGSTWTVMTVLLLMRRGQPLRTAREWFSSMTYTELVSCKTVERMSKPRCVKTHLPFDRLSYSPDAKYIFVTRQPADCLVSYYHFTNYIPYHESLSFDQVFDLFLEGKYDYSDFSSTICSRGTSRGICPTCSS